MPYVFFHDHFPEIGERETRTILVFEDSALELLPGEYSLLEMYCDEPGCDCRRVFFYVVSSSRRKDVEAVIAYGWESREFYARWLHDDDPAMIRELQGPVLNPGSQQSELAPAILDAVEGLVLRDQLYIERLKVHYRMFREKIDRKKPGGSRRAAPSRKGTASRKKKKKKRKR